MDHNNQVVTRKGTVIQDPGIARWLFSDVRSAPIWFLLRIWLAFHWLESGIGKLDNPAWTSTGQAIRGFWQNAVTIPESGRPPIAFDWYRNFIQFLLDVEAWTWFSKLIVLGEIAIGALLLLGLFTGIAAFLGGFMNWNFIMAGAASTNGMLFLVSVLLMLAWKVAGYWGLDRWVLHYLGTPWPGEEAPETKSTKIDADRDRDLESSTSPGTA